MVIFGETLIYSMLFHYKFKNFRIFFLHLTNLDLSKIWPLGIPNPPPFLSSNNNKKKFSQQFYLGHLTTMPYLKFVNENFSSQKCF